MLYSCWKKRFLGNKLTAEAKKTIDLEIKNYDTIVYCLPFHSFITVLFFVAILSDWMYMIYFQMTCMFFANKYPNCDIPNKQINRIGDGKCDGGIFNSVQCELVGRSCLSFNITYPNCDIIKPKRVGDRVCNEEFNNIECDYDGTTYYLCADTDQLLGSGIYNDMI